MNDTTTITHHAHFEVREDEETGRRYWYGAEDGWKDATDVGDEHGRMILDPKHYAVGTVLVMTEPLSPFRHELTASMKDSPATLPARLLAEAEAMDEENMRRIEGGKSDDLTDGLHRGHAAGLRRAATEMRAQLDKIAAIAQMMEDDAKNEDVACDPVAVDLLTSYARRLRSL
jgi:hypothetical protein